MKVKRPHNQHCRSFTLVQRVNRIECLAFISIDAKLH